jgi:c-di-GMP-binding flagellar brake protein YcgR
MVFYQHTDRIQGQKRLRFFNQLRTNKTLIVMYLLGTGYERLTMITDVDVQDGTQRFQIDYPTGFKRAIEGMNPWRIRFECNLQDRLTYLFRTTGGEINGREIWLGFPAFIERKQRRKDFRVKAPSGAQLCFASRNGKIEASVLNVSLAGALISIDSESAVDQTAEPGDVFHNLVLSYTSKGEVLKIHIHQAMVKRSLNKGETPMKHYALHFNHLKRDQQKKFHDLIYTFQRKELRKMREGDEG